MPKLMEWDKCSNRRKKCLGYFLDNRYSRYSGNYGCINWKRRYVLRRQIDSSYVVFYIIYNYLNLLGSKIWCQKFVRIIIQCYSIVKAFSSEFFSSTKISIIQLMLDFKGWKIMKCQNLQSFYNNNDRKPNFTFYQ